MDLQYFKSYSRVRSIDYNITRLKVIAIALTLKVKPKFLIFPLGS